MSKRSHQTAGRSPLGAYRVPRNRVALLGAVLLATLVVGCSSSGNLDNSSSPVVLVVNSLEAVNTPFGDMLSASGSIPEDSVRIRFTARLKNATDTTTPTLQDIVIERYEVTFNRTDGGSAVPAGFSRAMNAKVQLTAHGQAQERFTEVELVLVPSTEKSQPPLSFLISPGLEPSTGFINIQATATLRFYGKTLAGEPVSAQASIGVNFANFADEN